MRDSCRLMAAGGVALVLIALAATPARAVVPGQVDDFESGSVLNWQNSSTVLDPPPATPPHPGIARNIATGGPAGANDNFLQIGSSGGSGPGSKLVVFNLAQWTGNYLDQGINAIQMHVNNTGATDLTLRLLLVSGPAGAAQTLCTVADVDVPDASGWQLVTFPLTAANLQAGPGSDFATVMGNVTELNLAYGADPFFLRSESPPIVAQLGFDNVTAVAVPEPSVLGVAGAGVFAAAALRRGRRTRACK